MGETLHGGGRATRNPQEIWVCRTSTTCAYINVCIYRLHRQAKDICHNHRARHQVLRLSYRAQPRPVRHQCINLEKTTIGNPKMIVRDGDPPATCAALTHSLTYPCAQIAIQTQSGWKPYRSASLGTPSATLFLPRKTYTDASPRSRV